jgi:hypothetical protein
VNVEQWRWRLLWLAVFVAALSALHLADHAIRGNVVVTHGLNPHWNHSGWPFQPKFTEYTFALIVVSATFIIGIAGMVRGRLMAGYWVVTLIFLLGFVVLVHFVGSNAETPTIIYQTYLADGSSIAGTIALVIFYSIIVFGTTLVVLAANAGIASRRGRLTAPH